MALEGNKIIAAVLTAGILAVGSGVFSRMIYAPEMPHEHAYKIEVPEAVAEGGAAPAAPAEPIEVRLAAADPAKGQAAAKVCASCHAFDKGGANKVGPGLWGVVEREIGKHEGFSYSPAMAGKGGAWDFSALDAFLTAPRTWLPGTKMTYAGVSDPKARADIIDYLRTLADSPVPKQQGAALEVPKSGS